MLGREEGHGGNREALGGLMIAVAAGEVRGGERRHTYFWIRKSTFCRNSKSSLKAKWDHSRRLTGAGG